MPLRFDHASAKNDLVVIDLSENLISSSGPLAHHEIRVRVTFTPIRSGQVIVGLDEMRLIGRFHECEARRAEASEGAEVIATKITTTRGHEKSTGGTAGIKGKDLPVALESKGTSKANEKVEVEQKFDMQRWTFFWITERGNSPEWMFRPMAGSDVLDGPREFLMGVAAANPEAMPTGVMTISDIVSRLVLLAKNGSKLGRMQALTARAFLLRRLNLSDVKASFRVQ